MTEQHKHFIKTGPGFIGNTNYFWMDIKLWSKNLVLDNQEQHEMTKVKDFNGNNY